MKKRSFILILILNTFLLASGDKKETISDMELQKQLEREAKYAKEQTFYQGEKFDLKSFEINADSIKSIPDIEEDDSDDDVLEMD